jgi:hypothetical protein
MMAVTEIDLSKLRRRMTFWLLLNVLGIVVPVCATIAWLNGRDHYEHLSTTTLKASSVQADQVNVVDEQGVVRGSLSIEGVRGASLRLGDELQLIVSDDETARIELDAPNGHVTLGIFADHAELTLLSGDPMAEHSRVSLLATGTQATLTQETANGTTRTGLAEIGAGADGSWVRLWSIDGTNWQAPRVAESP